MDDIEYSMMIAEKDWRSFHEECEECCFLQPLLAVPDGANLSEESGISTVLREQQTTYSDKSIRSTEVIEGDPTVTQGETGDSKLLTSDGMTKLETEDKQVQTEGTPDLTPTDEKNPEPSKSITFRQEKERWFVTVNDSPSQLCRRVTAENKRRRPKKVRKNKRTCRECNEVEERTREEELETEKNTELDQTSKKKGDDPEIENLLSKYQKIDSKTDTETNRGLMMDQAPKKMDSTESEEFEDALDFPICEGFQSAAESQEDFQHPQSEPVEASITDQGPSENHDKTQESEISISESAFEDSSSECAFDQTCDVSSDTCLAETPRQLSSPPAVTVTAPDSPEAFARAAGHTRPVYAISAFWDEMEKLTINDILKLRRAESPALVGAEESPAANTEGYCSLSQMETSDNSDSDYFTQTDESKPVRSSWDFSTSDFEECWQFVGASRNSSPNPLSKHTRRDSPTSGDSDSTCSEGRETPVPPEYLAGHTHEDIIEEVSWQKRMRKSKSLQNVKELDLDDLLLITKSAEDDTEANTIEQRISSPVLADMDLLIQENKCLTDGSTAQCVSIFGAGVFSEYDFTLDQGFPNFYQHYENKPIPIFSSSHPTVRELTSPSLDHLFLSSMKETNFSPIRIVSNSPMQTSADCETLTAGGSGKWMSSLSLRRISFPDKGRIWSRSAVSFLPRENEKKLILPVITEGRLMGRPLQILEVAERGKILETIPPTRRVGVLSTLRQSDMCLVCIAFASWVLTSSDPDNADAWKAAVLANVSALSAIQYLRHYLRRRTLPPHGP